MDFLQCASTTQHWHPVDPPAAPTFPMWRVPQVQSLPSLVSVCLSIILFNSLLSLSCCLCSSLSLAVSHSLCVSISIFFGGGLCLSRSLADISAPSFVSVYASLCFKLLLSFGCLCIFSGFVHSSLSIYQYMFASPCICVFCASVCLLSLSIVHSMSMFVSNFCTISQSLSYVRCLF